MIRYHASLYNGLSISADKTTNMMADEMSSDDEDDQNVDGNLIFCTVYKSGTCVP